MRDLVAANRILAREGVVDAFGHVSIRKPGDSARYIMSRSRSPELVELSDLMEFELDGTPVDARGRTPYGERMIHGAIYEARPDTQSVVHNHSYDVLPFSVTSVRLQSVVHVASVIGHEVPVWDIRERFGDTDMLVRTMAQGRDMAKTLAENSCLLMRGHGAVIAGHSLREAVLTAIYLQVNARIQLQALQLGDPKVLSTAEINLTRETQFSPLSIDRVWEYFLSRVAVK
ncbi:MAG: class II aldolase/adducin family protein [Geminicoccales bacterium]